MLPRVDPAMRATKASMHSSTLVCPLQRLHAGNSNPRGRCFSGKMIFAGWCSMVSEGVPPPQKQQIGCFLMNSDAFMLYLGSFPLLWSATETPLHSPKILSDPFSPHNFGGR